MKFYLSVFCLMNVIVGVYGENGLLSCVKVVHTGILNCISKSSDFSSLPLGSFPSFYENPPRALCSNKTEFLSLLKCVRAAYLKCGDEFKTFFPTDKMNEKTVNYLCSRINSYNVTCLQDSLDKIVYCMVGFTTPTYEGIKAFTPSITTPTYEGIEAFTPSITNPTYANQKAFLCGLKNNHKNCTEYSTELDKCPETKKTYLELNKLQNPEACGGEAGFESGIFDDGKNSAPPLYQSVVLLTTIILMKFIF